MLVEETRVPEENQRSAESHLQTLSHNVVEYISPWTGFKLTHLVVIGTSVYIFEYALIYLAIFIMYTHFYLQK